ncbi:hypothetical protein [Acetivibrio ethanolgignens]|uniref:Uncharacterized protein n=1 Tax=Acetivibrio ethanolgignens TaxID=290052 RepID=A0A0V8QEV4_9FIRM|nr:hypothetical protein [Acetivibrio ethanolgignens]KSV59149.1 hypothetical protein ASU35_10345 [Acetivibrio ethanolgignens]
MSVFELINEDGTAMDDFPENPLKEKRGRLYPPLPMPQYSFVLVVTNKETKSMSLDRWAKEQAKLLLGNDFETKTEY